MFSVPRSADGAIARMPARPSTRQHFQRQRRDCRRRSVSAMSSRSLNPRSDQPLALNATIEAARPARPARLCGVASEEGACEQTAKRPASIGQRSQASIAPGVGECDQESATRRRLSEYPRLSPPRGRAGAVSGNSATWQAAEGTAGLLQHHRVQRGASETVRLFEGALGGQSLSTAEQPQARSAIPQFVRAPESRPRGARLRKLSILLSRN